MTARRDGRALGFFPWTGSPRGFSPACPVAQLVERRSVKAECPGSSPGGTATPAPSRSHARPTQDPLAQRRGPLQPRVADEAPGVDPALRPLPSSPRRERELVPAEPPQAAEEVEVMAIACILLSIVNLVMGWVYHLKASGRLPLDTPRRLHATIGTLLSLAGGGFLLLAVELS